MQLCRSKQRGFHEPLFPGGSFISVSFSWPVLCAACLSCSYVTGVAPQTGPTFPPRTAMPILRACSPVAAPRSNVAANLMSTARLRWKSAYIFFLALVTATWGRCCCQQEQQRQEAGVCNDGHAATYSDADPMATYPRAPDKSTRLVQELLSPFSLQDFAENYWERMPLVIRGRCVWSMNVMMFSLIIYLIAHLTRNPACGHKAAACGHKAENASR